MGAHRRTFQSRIRAGLLVVLAAPVAAAAQPPPPKTPALPRFDATASVGWLGADTHDLPGEVYRSWAATGIGNLSFGYYWTEHFKTEIEAGVSGERELYGSESIQSERNISRYVTQEHLVTTNTLSITPIYQFLHNTWVHPFVGAGIDVDWERRETETAIRTFISGPPAPTTTIENLPEEIDRRVRVRAALAAGMKVYFVRRAFVRTDLRISTATGLEAVRWRFGGGIDF